MAKGIKELKPITDDGDKNVVEGTLFEGVTGTPDDQGILARKVSGKNLEDFIARESGAVDTGLIEGKAKPYTDVETARAQEVEGALADLETVDKNSLVAAINSERAERIERGTDIDRAKANKIIKSRALSTIQSGEAPGRVVFWRSSIPAVIPISGRLELSDGACFQALNGGAFSYFSGGGAETVIYDGIWRKDEIDTGSATVSSSLNIEGSVWEYSRFGGVDADLPDVQKTAVDAIKKAADALQSVTAVSTGLTNETADRKAADTALGLRIDGEETDRTAADADLQTAITDETTDRTDADTALGARIDALPVMPALPAADGEYKLVITGGVAAWEVI